MRRLASSSCVARGGESREAASSITAGWCVSKAARRGSRDWPCTRIFGGQIRRCGKAGSGRRRTLVRAETALGLAASSAGPRSGSLSLASRREVCWRSRPFVARRSSGSDRLAGFEAPAGGATGESMALLSAESCRRSSSGRGLSPGPRSGERLSRREASGNSSEANLVFAFGELEGGGVRNFSSCGAEPGQLLLVVKNSQERVLVLPNS